MMEQNLLIYSHTDFSVEDTNNEYNEVKDYGLSRVWSGLDKLTCKVL